MTSITFLFKTHPEIGEKILLLLDHKSILSCQLVSKVWYDIISTPHFWLIKLQEEGGFALHDLSDWRHWLLEYHNTSPTNVAIARGLKYYFYFFLRKARNENLTVFIKSLPCDAMAYLYEIPCLLQFMISKCQCYEQKAYLSALYEDLVDGPLPIPLLTFEILWPEPQV